MTYDGRKRLSGSSFRRQTHETQTPKTDQARAVRLRFSKDKVSRETLTLSSEKERQELEAITLFVGLFNELNARQLSGLVPLEQDDHDFSAKVDGALVNIQLTELVDRLWIRDSPPPGQSLGRLQIHLVGTGTNYVDVPALDDALRGLIETKMNKHYAKPERGAFWLVVFCTGSYVLEHISEGKLVQTQALELARNFLKTLTAPMPFDEIWFTDLQTVPIQVWPGPSVANP